MTEREISEALLELCRTADRMRPPSHRNTIEDYHAERDAYRDGARRLYHRLTGRWPDQPGSGPARRESLPIPTAVLRHRERRAAARRTA